MDGKKIIELTNKIYRLTLLFPKKEPLRYKIRGTADDVLSEIISWEILHSENPGSFAKENQTLERDLIFLIERDFDILNGFLEVAKWQNWASYFEVLEIQEKYAKIKVEFKEELERLKTEKEQRNIEKINSELQAESELLVQESESEVFEEKERTECYKCLPGEEKPKESEDKAVQDRSFTSLQEKLEQKEKEIELDQRKKDILNILKEKGKIQVGEVNKIMPDVSKRTLRRDFQKLLELKLIERIGESNNTFYQLKD